MISDLKNSLFINHRRMFERINELSQQFAAIYCGGTIVKDNIFSIIENYARKNDVSLEVLRYPVNDDDLYAMCFIKGGTIFLYVNTKLPLCKQFYAAAHELYHIYRYVEACKAECLNFGNDDEANHEAKRYLIKGSILDADTANGISNVKEDLYANVFARIILMPDDYIFTELRVFGIDKENIDVDKLLLLLSIFAIPYKDIVLRLYECSFITYRQAEKLLCVTSKDVNKRIELTGNGKCWLLDGKGTESFGTLLEKVYYNAEHDYLTASRKADDLKYIDDLKNELGMNEEVPFES